MPQGHEDGPAEAHHRHHQAGLDKISRHHSADRDDGTSPIPDQARRRPMTVESAWLAWCHLTDRGLGSVLVRDVLLRSMEEAA